MNKGKSRKRPNVEPFTQGELDGLCGIYVVLNAFRTLFGEEFSYERAQRLFVLLVGAFPRAAAEGQSYKELLNVLTLANANVPKHFRLEVRTDVFRKQAGAAAWRTDTFLKRLRQEVQDGDQLAVLGIEKAIHHWTLLDKITPATLKLNDSDKLGVLRLKDLSTHRNTRKIFHLNPSQTILLRPWVGSPNDKYKQLKTKPKVEL